MKVAVTGGNGFVAGYMRKEFEKANMDAVFLARHGSNYQSIRGCTETDYSVASLCNIFHHCCVGGGGGKCYCSFGRAPYSCAGYILL